MKKGKLALLSIITSLAFTANVKASSLSLSCVNLYNEHNDIIKEVEVSITEQETIVGTIIDDGDQTTLECVKKSSPFGAQGYVFICEGQWDSDGSSARTTVSHFGFVPMVNVRRSETVFGAERLSGICEE